MLPALLQIHSTPSPALCSHWSLQTCFSQCPHLPPTPPPGRQGRVCIAPLTQRFSEPVWRLRGSAGVIPSVLGGPAALIQGLAPGSCTRAAGEALEPEPTSRQGIRAGQAESEARQPVLADVTRGPSQTMIEEMEENRGWRGWAVGFLSPGHPGSPVVTRYLAPAMSSGSHRKQPRKTAKTWATRLAVKGFLELVTSLGLEGRIRDRPQTERRARCWKGGGGQGLRQGPGGICRKSERALAVTRGHQYMPSLIEIWLCGWPNVMARAFFFFF